MKQLYFYILSILAIFLFCTSCSISNKYTTRATSLENEAYILILSEYLPEIENVTVIIDQTEEYLYPVVFSEKKSIKMKPIITTPGTKNIKIIYMDQIVYNKNILLGHRETRKITIR